jgi:hypothetical protein
MIYMYSSQHGRDWCGSLWRHAHERSILKIHAAQVHVHVSFHTSHTIGDKPHHRSLIRSTAICWVLHIPTAATVTIRIRSRGTWNKIPCRGNYGTAAVRAWTESSAPLTESRTADFTKIITGSDTVYRVHGTSRRILTYPLDSLDWLWRMRSSSLVGRPLGHVYHVVMWTEPKYWPMPKLKNSFWSSDLIC